MKRGHAILASLGLFLVGGCARDYDVRLTNTIDNRKYQRRLNDNLEAPPTKTNLQTSDVYVRPPKGLKGPTQTFGLPGVEAGKFDIEDSFIDQQKSGSLHVLARVDRPKAATKKAASPAAASARGDFTADVLDLVKSVYGSDLDTSKLKTETKSHGRKTNAYKTVTLDLTTKPSQVKVYFYGEKNSPEKVALIFDYPKDEYKSLVSKIDLCLESFRVGPEASRAFSGGEEELGGEEGAAAPASGVF
jgi:hypothetical protein